MRSRREHGHTQRIDLRTLTAAQVAGGTLLAETTESEDRDAGARAHVQDELMGREARLEFGPGWLPFMSLGDVPSSRFQVPSAATLFLFICDNACLSFALMSLFCCLSGPGASPSVSGNARWWQSSHCVLRLPLSRRSTSPCRATPDRHEIPSSATLTSPL